MKKAEGLLFSYPGSKWRLAPRFQQHYPPHRIYVDLFGGSGALLARQTPTPVEILNDLDSDVFNVFAVVKDPAGCNEVLRLLATTSYDREQYKLCKQVLADLDETSVRRAWAFVTCGAIGFAAHPALKNGWSGHERQRQDLLGLPAKVRWWHRRLQQVRLENRRWQEIVDLYDAPDTFFMCDPPYLPGVLRCAADRYYQHQMGVDAHAELIEQLRKIKGYAWICGYHHPLYTRLLFHWRRISFRAREAMGSRVGKRQEIAWLNYESDGSKIEENRLGIAKRYIQIMDGAEEAIKYVERIQRLRRLLDDDHRQVVQA